MTSDPLASAIEFRVTANVKRSISEGGAIARRWRHIALDPEHILSALLDSPETTAFLVLRQLGLNTQATCEVLDQHLNDLPNHEPSDILQRGGRLRPLMAMSIRYASEVTAGVVYSANLVYAMASVVPGPVFDFIRKQVNARKVHDTIFSSLHDKPEVWSPEYIDGFLWRITQRHLEHVIAEASREYVELPFT